MSAPSLVLVSASLDKTRSALLSLGATAQNRRSVAFDLGNTLVLLDHDRADQVTTVAVGGDDAVEVAAWLAHQFEDVGCRVVAVLPPFAPGADAVSA